MADQSRMPKKGNGDTLLIACGALAHEIIALNRANQWDCFTVECIPAKIHWSPKKIPAAIQEKIHTSRGKFKHIYVLFGDCGTAGELDTMLEKEGIERIGGPHCFSFLAGNDHFEEMADGEGISAFYLTDFMVKHFDKFFWEGLWLDKHPELLPMYFGNYTKVIYTAQIEDQKMQQAALAIANRLGLEYEYRYTGYGDLQTYMRDTANTVIPITTAT